MDPKIDWPAHIVAQQSSGSAQKVYCKANNLNFHSFSYHVQKSKGKGKRPGRSKSAKFLPVNLKANSSTSVHSYEVSLSHGNSLKISKGFDFDEVKRLLSIIVQS